MTIEFVIGDEPYMQNGKWHVPGRCITDVAVGGTFTTMIKYASVYDAEKRDWEMIYADPVTVDLTIEKITSYKRDWDSLSSGMTALLVLSTSDSPALENHVVLRG